ncbi:hypothetical protein [Leptospira adleri]|uniref:Uncharacterized protein n=1 Tax=Leptospira adleri TaxID=2023186 RepID=A0A2M9YJ65_9LEPT|nr:hypothetical protein [Leptospira adleri]PJZ51578.1 hypothetical protein CH380_19220 [Leptospira adleri]PJZ61913.1 hypothetical protein CH376_10945 [Leptospira adleri]
MIAKYLSLFNRSGAVFKALFFDPERIEKPQIKNINDINKGAVFNALEWHYRFVKRLIEEFPLTNASGFLLKAWGTFLGVPNDQALPDPEYRAKILSKILAIVGTLPAIKNLVKNIDRVEVKEAQDLGFFLDVAYLDTPVLKNRPFGSVMTHPTNAIYIIFNTIFDIDSALLRTIYQLKSAGIGVFAGVITEYPKFGFLYLDYGFIDKDYSGVN